jgi:hypothetical protein
MKLIPLLHQVPTCCSCHIDGYKEAFPPLALHNGNNNIAPNHKEFLEDFNPASSNRNSQYSTLNGAEYSTEEEYDYENIAYQYGNGFQKLKHPRDNPALSSVTKIRFDRPPTSPKSPFPITVFSKPPLESFLSPPGNDYEANFPFKSKPVNLRNRRPPTSNRKSLDQSISASEIKFQQATMLPPKLDQRTTERLRSKIVPPPKLAVNDGNPVNLRLPNSNPQSSDLKRVNYNYHPIIEFFEDDEPPKNGIDRKSGRADDDWKPMVQNHELDDPRLKGH